MPEQLKDLKIGESAEIVGFDASDPSYRRRLLSMGLTRGTVLTLMKVAPLGDPIEVMVRDYHLSLRKVEADILQIRKKS